MRTRLYFFAIGICLVLASNLSLRAQRVVYWKGGAPGMETNWNMPGNWSNNAVPDAFCNVVIPDVSTRSGASPVLGRQGAEVNSLTLESGASLVIQETGALVVYDRVERFGLQTLEVHGSLTLNGDVSLAGMVTGKGNLNVLGKSK